MAAAQGALDSDPLGPLSTLPPGWLRTALVKRLLSSTHAGATLRSRSVRGPGASVRCAGARDRMIDEREGAAGRTRAAGRGSFRSIY